MKNLIALTVLLLVSTTLLKAQDTLKHRAQPDSVIKLIPYNTGRHVDYMYTINGKLQSPDDIRMRLLSYAPSASEYQAAKTNFRWSFISLGGVAVCGTAALIEFEHNNKFAGESTAIINGQPEFVYQHHSLTGAYVFTGLATAFLATEIITLINGAKHGHKALKVYNQRFE